MKIDMKGKYSQYLKGLHLSPYCKPVGTVELDDGMMSALVWHNQDKNYCYVNKLTSGVLDQDEVKRQIEHQAIHRFDDKKSLVTVTLDDKSKEILRRYGDGNLSLGVRMAADLVKLCSGG